MRRLTIIKSQNGKRRLMQCWNCELLHMAKVKLMRASFAALRRIFAKRKHTIGWEMVGSVKLGETRNGKNSVFNEHDHLTYFNNPTIKYFHLTIKTPIGKTPGRYYSRPKTDDRTTRRHGGIWCSVTIHLPFLYVDWPARMQSYQAFLAATMWQGATFSV